MINDDAAAAGIVPVDQCLPERIWAVVKNRDVPDFLGAPDTIRTCDLCLRRATLS